MDDIKQIQLLKDAVELYENGAILEAKDKAIEFINNITDFETESNERMVGSWIKSRDSYGTNHFTCPYCEHDIATKAENWDDNYCANCGADLRSAK